MEQCSKRWKENCGGGGGAGVRSPQGWPESGKSVTDLWTIISQRTITAAVKTVLQRLLNNAGSLLRQCFELKTQDTQLEVQVATASCKVERASCGGRRAARGGGGHGGASMLVFDVIPRKEDTWSPFLASGFLEFLPVGWWPPAETRHQGSGPRAGKKAMPEL